MIQTLVSVPPQLAAWLRSPRGMKASVFGVPVDFVRSDPLGAKLGSGGGTLSLLHSAWRASKSRLSLEDWIAEDQRVVLHAGGESRRLPAYASIGKALIPIPVAMPGRPGRHDQVLADLQLPLYRQVLAEAGRRSVLMVASGDVWLELNPLAMPHLQSDIVGIGMRVSPEVAQHFGVFFVPKLARTKTGGAQEHRISFFLQKPSPAKIFQHAAHYDYYVDTGLWLFSAPAVNFLLRRCGWNQRQQRFSSGTNGPRHLDLYTEIGSALGTRAKPPAALRRLGWSALTASVIPMEDAKFFHVGSSRQLLDTFEQLTAGEPNRSKTFAVGTLPSAISSPSSLPVWIDGAAETKWTLEGDNIVTGQTGVGRERLRLRAGQCVELAPVGVASVVVRPYGLKDTMKGSPTSGATLCGQPASSWLARRGLPADGELFGVPLYPVVGSNDPLQPIVDWFFADQPDPGTTARMQQAPRIAAAEIPNQIAFDRLFAQRTRARSVALIAQLTASLETGDARLFKLDFSAIAAEARRSQALRQWLNKHGSTLLARTVLPEHQSRLLMLLAEVGPRSERERLIREAYARLQRGVLMSEPLAKAQPRLALKEDQIVWARSPVRLDLAGGWTDTPPYCFEFGGSVLNAAVLLNGQPPIQVFVRPVAEPVLRLRSIDLGVGEQITTIDALGSFRDPRSGFSLPKAALAMAGFHPDFGSARWTGTLRERLRRFGGGLEISLLSAVPKGSGLGTSSILAATILGALNRACALGWDEVALYNHVLGVEQLLTTGGGWQDQAGALFRGIKLVETHAGPSQSPTVHYLPQHLFGPGQANQSLLLYYTGITRLAKGILKEIVHAMFLGRFDTLQTLGLIRANALELFSALQRHDRHGLHRCIERSWKLNNQLDPGTTTPAIERILQQCGADLAAAKLLGAGGGGYMLLCAKTPEAGQRIRDTLEKHPPNPRARFIDFEIADSGLEVTVS